MASSLVQITDKEYAERIARDISKQSAYDSWEWTGKGWETRLIVTYYSELGIAILQIQTGSRGSKRSIFFMGNSSDVGAAVHSWVSFWDMTSRRY